MGYFNSPHTQEELDGQCRQLLLKHGYRSGKNSPVTEAILKEYNELQMQIARANGYRTVGEKAASAVKEAVKEISGSYSQAKQEIQKERQKEQQRIDRLKNHRYTREETQSLILECKRLIADILKADARSGGILENVIYKDDEYVTRWFNTNTDMMASEPQRQAYDKAREKLEYALKSAAGNKRTQETYMLQSERLFGAFIKKKFREYQDIYGDPVRIAQADSARQKQMKSDKKGYAFLSVMIGMIVAVLAVSALVLIHESDKAAGTPPYLLYGAVITFAVAVPVRKWMLSLSRKTFNGIGERKRLSRISERNEFRRKQRETSFVRLILRLFGI